MLARIIVLMMAGVVVMTLVMVMATVLWTAEKNNESAASDSSLMIGGGYEALEEALIAINWDYSSWTAALDNTNERNIDWLTENMGAGANGDSFGLIQITLPEDWSSLVWTKESLETVSYDAVIPENIVREVHSILVSKPVGKSVNLAFAVNLDGRIYLVAAHLLQPWGEAPSVPINTLPINLMARELSDEVLSGLGSSFLVDDLSIVTDVPDSMASLPIQDISGDTLIYLAWTPPRPGAELMRIAAVPLSIGVLVFLALSGIVTVLARNSANELVRREDEALKIARTDTLTGLPNRLGYNEHISKLRLLGGSVAILFIDVNRFKDVNDNYGHAVGDKYIELIASKAMAVVGDNVLFARIGGDEFAGIFAGADAKERCVAFSRELTHELGDSVRVGDHVFSASLAKGYAAGDQKDMKLRELAHRADAAMYEAKNRGMKEALEYTPELEKDAKWEAEIVRCLNIALEDADEFDVVYQPIFDVNTRKMKSAEALLRWHSKILGHVSPEKFVPIAERQGKIEAIGRWVIAKVLLDMSEYEGLHVNINLSPYQLRSKNLVNEIVELVEELEVSPERITFEITEGVLIEEPDFAAFTLDTLRDHGFSIAIDDFGTGYSSIGYLRQFAFDKLKIDKSFVDDLGLDEKSESLMTALAYLSRSLGLEIVAEGVETESQFNILKELGYDQIQGYFLSRPVPLSDLQDAANAPANTLQANAVG
ncbi:MAG: EAL domain-containing protein [Silicimonas sp.]|nr:EAL domain-containing protein [Silicimonas sp.]